MTKAKDLPKTSVDAIVTALEVTRTLKKSEIKIIELDSSFYFFLTNIKYLI